MCYLWVYASWIVSWGFALIWSLCLLYSFCGSRSTRMLWIYAFLQLSPDLMCSWTQIMKLLLSRDVPRTWFASSLIPHPWSSFPFQDAGIWFVFHSSSTGDSHGLVPETKAELTPLGIFYNNRVHSNFKVFVFKWFYGEVYAFSPRPVQCTMLYQNCQCIIRWKWTLLNNSDEIASKHTTRQCGQGYSLLYIYICNVSTNLWVKRTLEKHASSVQNIMVVLVKMH